jgi:acyl-CoA synthetase (AMP-forming)/AMP-acid ligase II
MVSPRRRPPAHPRVMYSCLTQTLHRAEQVRPNATATISSGRRQTYAEFTQRVRQLAGALRRLGLEPGDRVGMLALNSDRYLEYYLGVWWAGGVVNPVNTRWSSAEIVYSLDDCDTRLLLVDDQFSAVVPALLERSTCLRTVIHVSDDAAPSSMLSYEALVAEGEPVEDVLRRDDDLAGIFYTGGTTGFPKGVMLSHGNLLSNALAGLVEVPMPSDWNILHVAPLFHLAAMSLVIRALVRAAGNVMLPAFNPLGVIQLIESEHVNSMLLVPTMIQSVVDHPKLREHDLSSLKQILYGASPISEALLDRALDAFPGVEFAQGYGMTELSSGISFLLGHSHTPAGRAAGKLRSVGQAICGVDVRILDSQGCELTRGKIGEIVVRSPGMMLGYWNKPEASEHALRGGWMHTGDAGYLDEDGYLYIVDRLKDMIITGAENVYSAEVENALASHPTVAACAVLRVPDEKWGEAVHAVVVLKEGARASDEELRSHCRTLIAGYKCPRSFEFRSSLPLSGTGKLLKYQLREEYWGEAKRSNRKGV